MIKSYRVGSIPTRATINNPLNNKTMKQELKDLINSGEFYNKLGIMDLYRTARKKMKPVETVSNKFMQYV